MTNVKCYIKYSPDLIDVSASVMDRVDIWKKATDGVGRYGIKLKNDSGEWLGQFLADDPIQIKIEDAIFLEGYLDKGSPTAEAREDVYKQLYELVGRDYGQDLQNKIVNKTGDWMYKKQYADLILDDMLTNAGSEIQFTPSGDHKYAGVEIPQVQYTDRGDEYLQEAFRKIMEEINWDFYIDEDKNLKIFPIGAYDSGIILKNVAGASDNNILDLRKVEFDTFELRNYLIGKAGIVEDGYSDGNAADFTGATGNVVTDEFVNVIAGAGAIKCARGSGDECKLGLEFPKYNYDYLPFDIFLGKKDIALLTYVHPVGTLMPSVYVILEDDQGHRIKYFWIFGQSNKFPKDKYFQCVFPVGRECEMKKYGSKFRTHHWICDTDFQPEDFTWKIKKVEVHAKMIAGGDGQVDYIIIDDLRLPFPMVSYKQGGTSQELYKVRHLPVPAKDVRSQAELDEFTASELEKTKSPIKGLRIIAVGSAGIIGGVCKWIPGYCTKVNSPGDQINNAWYRIMEVHISVAEYPLFKGHDFIAEVTLIPYQTAVSGRRLSYVETPEIALIRALSDRVRFLEKKEEAKRDWFPAMPGPMGQKIMVGDFLALADTIIEWTRYWEESDFTIGGSTVIVSDAECKNGKAAKIPSAGGDNTEPLDSPSFKGEIGGDIYVLFRIKVASNASSSFLAMLRVVGSSVARGTYEIYPNNLPNNKYHIIAVRARIDANDTNAYADVWNFKGGITDLYVDYIGILPANVPLGYSDVTVLETDPGSTGDLVDPGSVGDLVDPGTTAQPSEGTQVTYPGINSTFLELRNLIWTSVLILEPDQDLETLLSYITLFTISNLGSSNEWEPVRIRIYDVNTGIYYPSVDGAPVYFWGEHTNDPKSGVILIPSNVNGHLLRLQAKSFYPTANWYVYWHRTGVIPHTHSIIGDSHTTPISGDSHTTPISNDAHTHSDEEGGHEH